MTTENKNWMYVNDRDNQVRYVLGTQGANPLVGIGVNPSTASPNDLDNTLKSLERIAHANGFDSWIMLNLYPVRATNPDDLPKPMDQELHQINLRNINQVLSQVNQPVIWPCWGTLILKRPYLLRCFQDIFQSTQNHSCRWVSFGAISKDGHPHHPLYLATNSPMEDFDVENYLQLF